MNLNFIFFQKNKLNIGKKFNKVQIESIKLNKKPIISFLINNIIGYYINH